MSQLQTNVSDIKTVAKNLARELKTMKFDISHSSALNLASRSLGYKNYQTYKGLVENIPHDEVYIDNGLHYNEYLKQGAYLVLRTKTTITGKINAIQKIMYSHFIRSALSALNQNRKHPSHFHDYAPHWLYADIDMTDKEEDYAIYWLHSNIIENKEIKKILLNKYPLPKYPKIAKGESYYYE